MLADVPSRPKYRHGYLDLLGDRAAGARTMGQQLMTSRALPHIYERLWRPMGARVLTGALGLGGAAEKEVTEELLELAKGDVVLDVACGPGNITRRLLSHVGAAGLAVGVDVSEPMLARAVADTHAPNATYVRADAQQLPFRDASFDAVCCYAALYLVEDPFAVISELARVLSPGGRIAVLTSVYRGPLVMRALSRAFTAPGGIHMFGPEEITDAFHALGLVHVKQRISGFAQFVGGAAAQS
jgi:SAM-dependent methyltransferase